MRTTSALKTAAVLTVAVVLGLGTVQGSLAAWNTTTSSNAGTVRAADFAVTLKSGSGPVQRLPVNGEPATLSLRGLTDLQPGKSRTVEVAVSNTTDAGTGAFRIQLTAQDPKISGKLEQHVKATVGFSATDDCASKLSTSVDLAQDAKATLCVSMTLEPNALATLGKQTNTMSVALTAAQR